LVIVEAKVIRSKVRVVPSRASPAQAGKNRGSF
jgi:hypothetical protein